MSVEAPERIWAQVSIRSPNEGSYSVLPVNNRGNVEYVRADKLRDELQRAVEIVRRHVPYTPPDGPSTPEHQAAYEAVGFALQDLERHVNTRNAGGKDAE